MLKHAATKDKLKLKRMITTTTATATTNIVVSIRNSLALRPASVFIRQPLPDLFASFFSPYFQTETSQWN